MKRTIEFSPSYRISKSGDVWNGNTRVFPFNHRGRFGLEHACVSIENERCSIESLLAAYWYDNQVILCRDGGVMRWHEDNVFTLTRVSKETLAHNFEKDEIQYIWYMYQNQKIWCYQMNEKAGLHLHGYSSDAFKSLITDILRASVK